MGWEKEPTILEYIPNDCEYILMVDESGQSNNFKNIEKKVISNQELTDSEKVLCLTGIIISVEEYVNNLIPKFNALKERYWENGLWFNPKYQKEEKVHFHSTDIGNIKNRRNCMRKLSDEEMTNFVQDLTKVIEELDFKIVSICLDNKKLINKYCNPYNNYLYATKLLFERYCLFLNNQKTKGIVVFESRDKEDNRQHKTCIDLLSKGTIYVKTKKFRRINGVYFNPKRPIQDKTKSYVGIELADLVSHVIFKMFIAKIKNSSYNGRDWQVVEKKLINYPDYNGYGLKFIP